MPTPTPTPTPKKRLLVIGGGLAGLAAISGLRKAGDKDTEITLVEPKNHCEIFWTAYRSPFEEWVAKDSLFPLDVFCKKHNVHHIMSIVTNLTLTEATVNGKTVPFDVCVVAVGADSKWAGMGRGLHKNVTREARLADMKLVGSKLLNAKNVLIVGGGLIGSELAGDVACYGGKEGPKVTLIQSKERLCLEMSEDGSEMVKSKLEKLGVKVILNDRAEASDKGKMVLKSTGEVIEADEVVMTIGLQPMNTFLAEPLKKEALDESGWLVTDNFLRVKGTNGKIFAFGDCEMTTLPTAGNQYMNASTLFGKNLKVVLASQGQPPAADSASNELLREIKAGDSVYCATLGRYTGIVQITPTFHTQFFVPWLKNKTGFVFVARQTLQL